MLACQCNPQVVSDLLNHPKININTQNNKGWNALMLACRYSPELVYNLMQKSELDINAKNKGGSTALMVACARKPNSIISILNHPEIDIKKQKNDGKKALDILKETDYEKYKEMKKVFKSIKCLHKSQEKLNMHREFIPV